MMARRIDSRLKVSCTLIARTPLHVGGMGGNVDTDLALAVNGEGGFYIPGTSLTGAFRGWFETRADKEEAKRKIRRLWGYQKQKRERQADEQEQKGNDEHASFVLVEDAKVTPPTDKQVLLAEIRDGVGIDRFTGAAANKIKFDRAVLPRGTRIKFKMLVELGGDESAQIEARSMTYTALQALQAGEIRFGAAKSRGLGRVEVAELNICEQGMLRKNGLLDTLRAKGKKVELGKSEKKALGFEERPRLTIDIAWKPRGPLMVKAEHDGFAVDMLPLVSAIDGHLTFVLPGSSIKGAFRSQAERIVRTLLPVEKVEIVEKKREFIKQLEVREPEQKDGPEHASLIGWLFGTAGDPAKEEDKNKTPLPGLSAVTFDDCYAELDFSAEQWSAVEQAKDEQGLRSALEGAKLSKAQQAFHIAIDRWLGSAADSFLYSVLEPHGVSWEPIRLSLDLARASDEDCQRRAVMLLLLVLRDFAAGRISLGFGVNRGMGAIEVTGINISADDCEKRLWLKELTGERLNAGKLNVPESLRKQLDDAWQTWIKQQTGEEGK